MALSMHTNFASLVTQNTLNNTQGTLNSAMQRLATGFRINSAADDAAGLQIANRLEVNTRGMSVAMRNAQDGISMMQTAEGAFDEMTNIAYRMNELATQSANGVNSAADRTALDAEFTELRAELTNILDNTSFAGQKLFNGAGFGAGAVAFQIGSESTQQLSVDVQAKIKAVKDAFTAPVGGGGGGGGGAAPAISAGIGDAAKAKAAVAALNAPTGSLISALGDARAQFGANINRLEHTIVNLGNMVENTSASKGRIMDADFATETSSMTKSQMLMQAGTNVLSRTNQMPSMVMSLLR